MKRHRDLPFILSSNNNNKSGHYFETGTDTSHWRTSLHRTDDTKNEPGIPDKYIPTLLSNINPTKSSRRRTITDIKETPELPVHTSFKRTSNKGHRYPDTVIQKETPSLFSSATVTKASNSAALRIPVKVSSTQMFEDRDGNKDNTDQNNFIISKSKNAYKDNDSIEDFDIDDYLKPTGLQSNNKKYTKSQTNMVTNNTSFLTEYTNHTSSFNGITQPSLLSTPRKLQSNKLASKGIIKTSKYSDSERDRENNSAQNMASLHQNIVLNNTFDFERRSCSNDNSFSNYHNSTGRKSAVKSKMDDLELL